VDVSSLYLKCIRKLEAAGISFAKRDVGVLFERICGHNPSLERIFSFVLSPKQENEIEAVMVRREKREPLARIFGFVDFDGVQIKVSKGVFRPCEDSPRLIDHAVAFYERVGRQPLRILDLGTGTGCLLLALLRRYPQATGVGIDVNKASIALAQENARRNSLQKRATFQLGDWEMGLAGPFDLIISNPPAVPTHHIASMHPEMRDFDPLEALDGGEDGLVFYRRLAKAFTRLSALDGVGVFQVYTPDREVACFAKYKLQTQIGKNYMGLAEVVLVTRPQDPFSWRMLGAPVWRMIKAFTVWLRPSFYSLLALSTGLALCVGLAVWQGVNVADGTALAASFSWFWASIVLLITAALMYCGERKWALLAATWTAPEALHPAPAFLRRHYLWQNWIAQFVPPSLAIIVGRGLASAQMPGGGMRRGVLSGLFDQATDFALLCAFLPGAALVLFADANWTGFVGGCAVGVALMTGVGLLIRPLCPLPMREAFWPLLNWSLTRALLTLLRLLIGVYALGLFVPLLPVATLTPIVSFVALLPLTPGNLGLAEWGWVGGLAAMGTSAHVAALYALGFRLLVLVAQTILLGLNEAYVFIQEKRATV